MSKTLGSIIKTHREAMGLSVRELAKELFVSPAALSRWETGARIPDLEKLSMITEYLNISPQEVLKGAEYMSPEGSSSVMFVEDVEVILKGSIKEAEKVIDAERIHGFLEPEAALDFARQNTVCLSFIDIKLRGENGLELAEALTQINPRMNIIFLTDYPEFMGDACKQHASGFLLKPLDHEKLMDELAHLRFPVWGIMP